MSQLLFFDSNSRRRHRSEKKLLRRCRPRINWSAARAHSDLPVFGRFEHRSLRTA
jgi:hypothetical protein